MWQPHHLLLLALAIPFAAMALVAPAAAIALALEEHPDRADSVLQAAGMTPEQFESLMYRIAADSTARMLFESARLN